jgi:hypothetical protein
MKARKPLLHAALAVLLAITLVGCGPNLVEMIGNFWSLSCCGAVVVVLNIIALVELAGSTRSTGDKVLWALLIILFPLLGAIIYFFFARR